MKKEKLTEQLNTRVTKNAKDFLNNDLEKSDFVKMSDLVRKIVMDYIKNKKDNKNG